MNRSIYILFVLLSIVTLPTIVAEEEESEGYEKENLASEKEEEGVEAEEERKGVEGEGEREEDEEGSGLGSGVSDLILYGTIITIASVLGYVGWKMYQIKKRSVSKTKV